MTDWQQVAGQLIANGAPVLGGVLGGPAGGALGGVIGSLIGQALGVAPTPEAIGAAIQADPAGASAKIGAVEDVHKTAMELAAEDIENARQMTVDLARAKSPIQWGSSATSAFVAGAFFYLFYKALNGPLPEGQLVMLIAGVVVGKFGTIVDFWTGSSNGSRDKDSTIASFSKAKR